MTLIEAKEQVAAKHNLGDWQTLKRYCLGNRDIFEKFSDEAAEIYHQNAESPQFFLVPGEQGEGRIPATVLNFIKGVHFAALSENTSHEIRISPLFQEPLAPLIFEAPKQDNEPFYLRLKKYQKRRGGK